MAAINLIEMYKQSLRGPRIERSLQLNFMGDWGMANFHRICSWLTQQFCDRAGKESQIAIWNIRHGGIEAVTAVFEGRMQMSIATPAQLMHTALKGDGIFAPYGPMPSLRAIGVLPQNDRLVFAIHPKYDIRSFEDLRRTKPAIRIATSHNDGTNFIGHVAYAFMESAGIDENELLSWGGKFITAHRPEQAVALALSGEADAILQEAIMTPWWESLVENNHFIPLPAEDSALARYIEDHPDTVKDSGPLPAGHWECVSQPLSCLDFSDFVLLVRDDMPVDVAHLLTWCLVETRQSIEAQYRHLRSNRSPLSYPLDPRKMAQTPIPLHPGAYQYYHEAGHLETK
jgi:uncharacterized protein